MSSSQQPRSDASRYHHSELNQRDRLGINLGWASLVLLLVGLVGYAGNSVLILWVKIALGLGVVLGIAYLAIRKDAALGMLTHPSTGQGASTTVFVIALLGILGFVNYIAGRHNHQFDLTKNQEHTLAPQTRDVLKKLPGEVTVTAFYQLSGRNAAEGQRARDMLQQYHDAAPGKVKFELIDPTANPARAMAKGVTSVPVVWFEAGGRKEQVFTPGEQEFTSAILKVTNPTKKKIYFLFGHGEKDIDGSDGQGLSDAKTVLEKLNYEVSKLVLQTVREVPADASVIVVAGPKNGLPANEQQLLSAYLQKGGKLLLLLDPKTPAPTALVQPWGVEVGNNVIIDPRLQAGQALVEKFEFHQITKDLQLGLFPLARSVSPAAAAPAGVNVASLAKTSELSWGETKVAGPFQRDGADLNGPVSLGVVATKEIPVDTPNQENDSKKGTRLVVFGNSGFATNAAFQAMNLSDAQLFLNSINWLAEEEALVNIQPKDPQQAQITLIDSQARWIFLWTVLLIPFGVLLAGVGTWWRRR